MNKEEMLKAVVDVLQEMDEDEFISINNRIFDEEDDNYIYARDEFDEVFAGYSPLEIADMVQGNSGVYNVNDWYFTKDSCEGLQSSDVPHDITDVNEVAEHIVEKRRHYCNEELEELFKKYDA